MAAGEPRQPRWPSPAEGEEQRGGEKQAGQKHTKHRTLTLDILRIIPVIGNSVYLARTNVNNSLHFVFIPSSSMSLFGLFV